MRFSNVEIMRVQTDPESYECVFFGENSWSVTHAEIYSAIYQQEDYTDCTLL